MIDGYAAADVRAAEEPLLAVERSFHSGLMHRAATALARAVRAELRERTGGVVGRVVVGLVGPGNNGGDTLHALALLRRAGVDVLAVLTSRAHDGGLAALRTAGGRTVSVTDDAPGAPVWVGDAVAAAFAADVVLDGLLGIGGRGGLRGTAAHVVEVLGPLLAESPVRPAVVAVDLPSGVGVDDGARSGPVLAADRTVTFGVAKPALLLPPAAHLAGRLEVVDLGLDPVLDEHEAAPVVRRLERDDVAALWRVPPAEAHKYARGVVGVVAGTPTYPGAAVLTVAGAQGAGCGMVRYVGPDAVARHVLAAHPEVVAGTSADVHVQAWVLGPGLADDDDQRHRAAEVLGRHATDGDLPVVVDAGALDLLPERVAPTVVLTPHAGELARLLGARGHDVDRAAVEAEPLRWARAAHEATGATVLLKGHVTLVVGDAVLAQAEAPTWLATAGAGDVLAGVVGAALAGHADAHLDGAGVAHVAAAGASVHGRAAHRARPDGPVTAGDVARAVPDVVAELVR